MDFAEEKIFKEYSQAEVSASLPAKRIYIKRGYIEKKYNIIQTENGDRLCFDTMTKER